MTKPLWESWAEIETSLMTADSLLACFDYDGTLTPIVSTPEEAIATPQVRGALRELGSLEGVVAVVVSGRPVKQLLELVPGEALWLIGHHGLCVRSPDGEESSMVDEETATKALEPLREIGQRVADASPGLRLEDKGSGLAMHTRNASRLAAKDAAELFCDEAQKLQGFSLFRGKEVYEVKPVGFDRGQAILALREKVAPEALVLYVGDDTPDEDAFRGLLDLPDSVTVKVGDGSIETAARYRVDDTHDAVDLLRRLRALRGKKG